MTQGQAGAVPSSLSWQMFRLRRHWHWARTQGFWRLVEEDNLDPVDRARTALRKRRWRRETRAEAGAAVAVFLVGLQRSGTNMMVRGLDTAPEFEVHNENDAAAFERFQLRPLPDVRRIVEASRHNFVLFKPLCDSHRVGEILDGLATPSPPKAVWAYRSVEGRTASALAKFGDVSRRVLADIAAGRGGHRWQAGRLSEESLGLLRTFDYERMTPATAAALFWYVRNSLFFELGLDRRDDMTLVCYEEFLAEPERRMRELCGFLGFAWTPALTAHIAVRPAAAAVGAADIDTAVRDRCRDLEARLAGVAASPR